MGYSSVVIGEKLNKDHSTILHHLKKMNLPEVKVNQTMRHYKVGVERYNNTAPDTTSYEANKSKEKLNKGKRSYADYLEEEKKRIDKFPKFNCQVN